MSIDLTLESLSYEHNPELTRWLEIHAEPLTGIGRSLVADEAALDFGVDALALGSVLIAPHGSLLVAYDDML